MARQTTLNVSLTPILGNFVRTMVSSGRYESASEVIRDSLRALQDRNEAAAAFWNDVRKKVRQAQREVAENQTVDGDAAMDEIISKLDQPPRKRRRAKSERR